MQVSNMTARDARNSLNASQMCYSYRRTHSTFSSLPLISHSVYREHGFVCKENVLL